MCKINVYHHLVHPYQSIQDEFDEKEDEVDEEDEDDEDDEPTHIKRNNTKKKCVVTSELI